MQNINNMRVENRHKRATYQRNFDIERSWIPNNNDITGQLVIHLLQFVLQVCATSLFYTFVVQVFCGTSLYYLFVGQFCYTLYSCGKMVESK